MEALGSQSIAYFVVDAEAVRPGIEPTDEEEQELDGEAAEGVTARRPNLVAAISAREALDLRLDERVPVAVDAGRVHLFDQETGAPLR